MLGKQVYSPYDPGRPWRPQPYAEGKGRYLWTDAFGVINFITLHKETGESRYLDQVQSEVKQST